MSFPGRPRSIIGPVVLIGLGIIFLLNNVGLLDWGVWASLWRLWPIILIGVGLDMVFGRRAPWASWVIAGVMVVTVGGAILYGGLGGFSGTTLRDEVISYPLGEATLAEVQIKSGVSRLAVAESNTPGILIDGTISPHVVEEIEQKASTTGNLVRFELRAVGVNIRPRNNVNTHWDLYLTQEVPIDLTVSTGVGASELDLSKLKITRLTVQTGIGKADITLPNTGSSQVDVQTGIGEVRIGIPAGVAARIEAKAGIGQVSVDSEFRRSGNYYETADYGTAVDRVDLQVQGGIGAIRIKRVIN